MGNKCVGSTRDLKEHGCFQSLSLSNLWPNSSSEQYCFPFHSNTNKKTTKINNNGTTTSKLVQSQPPETITIERLHTKQENKNVLGPEAGPLTARGFCLGRKLGSGQYGATFLCADESGRARYACKSIPKAGLRSEEDAEDVRREIRVMRHVAGAAGPAAALEGAYEDAEAVHIVMEVCSGGELFERIVGRGRYSEREATRLARAVVGAVEACHSLGVMHRDLKPENFLFVDHSEDSPLKVIDFGLSVFFKPGDVFTDVVGSPFYVAPEILLRNYGPEADIWSAGVIIYVLLCGFPPFFGESEDEILEEVLHGNLDFSSDPWPSISDSAKDLVKKMLVRDPKKRPTAKQVLCHPWVQADGVALDKPLDPAVLTRLKQFSAMNKLKKLALRVIAEKLLDEEIAGLKEMFRAFDADNSGQITFEELETGLKKFGANLNQSEIYQLMRAADVDNSGTVDCGEFIAATIHLAKLEKEDHLAAAFSYFDRDGSGFITQDELQRACEDFGIDDDGRFSEEMIQEVDQDNDGRIDYNEFVAMMQKDNADLGEIGSKRSTSFSVGFREALSVC